MNLTERDYQLHSQIVQAQHQIGAFAEKFIQSKHDNPTASSGAVLDSLTTAYNGNMPTVVLPEAVQHMIDLMPDDHTKLQQKQAILDGLEIGYKKYAQFNGGDKPSADIVASAILDSANMLDSLDISAQSHSHIAQVPALTLVTIASRIANALPLVSLLPNPIGSNELPLLNVRYTAKNSRGHFKAGDYIDGDKSNLQFIDSAFEFEAETVDRTTFQVIPRLAYLDGGNKPDTATDPLPFVAGGVTVLVNGVIVADDSNATHKDKGINVLTPKTDLNYSVGGVVVKATTGTANLTTHEISVTFENALPDDAQVTIEVYADYERSNDKDEPIIKEPALDISTQGVRLRGYANRSSFKTTDEALTQMQNELGVDPRSAFVAIATGKTMLEQNIRLLRKAKQRANGVGNVFIADLARGGNSGGVAQFNNTRDMSVELIPTIDMAIMQINSMSNHSANGYDIYLSGNMAVLMNCLPDDTRYVPTNNAVGALNQIVKIGTLKGSMNVYCIPESPQNPLFNTGTMEHGGSRIPYGEMLIVARNAEPAKSVFVGFDVTPLMTKEYTAEAFKSGVTMFSRQGRHINPLSQYGNQVALIKVVNIPTSLVGKV